MLKSIRHIKEFRDFTNVYKPKSKVFYQPSEYYYKRHDEILRIFDELVEQGVTSVALKLIANPLECSSKVDIYVGETQRNDLKQTYLAELEEFIEYATLTYHPNCIDKWGGEWWGWIRFTYEPKFEVEVTSRCSRNNAPTSVVSHMSTFRAELSQCTD
jgi:hypothetical protein